MAAGIGVPHPKIGEVGWAYVMKRPQTEIDPEEPRQICVKHLSDYKVPAQVLIRDMLPIMALGKIHKPTLAQEAKKQFA
jgi:acyl-CoA synthetase (AMP-forming)/AMP-acid ligase II